MIKFVACAAAFTACSTIGHLFARCLEKRVSALQDFEKAISLLKSRLHYYVEPVEKAVLRVGRLADGDVGHMFCMAAEHMRAGMSCREAMACAFSACREKEGSLASLSAEDIGFLLDLAESVGQDTYAQGAAFAFAESRLQVLIREADSKRTRLARLYRTSGMLVGGLVTVLFL